MQAFHMRQPYFHHHPFPIVTSKMWGRGTIFCVLSQAESYFTIYLGFKLISDAVQIMFRLRADYWHKAKHYPGYTHNHSRKLTELFGLEIRSYSLKEPIKASEKQHLLALAKKRQNEKYLLSFSYMAQHVAKDATIFSPMCLPPTKSWVFYLMIQKINTHT